MSLPPINPDKSTAGIVQDPRTLERVVPSSKRKDGTTRKELKIRPGFTPQEDVGRFRGSRQSAADARVGFVPGSNRPAPPKASDPENPFAQEPAVKSKAQVKNEKRRAAKRSAAVESTKAWDEMDSSDEEAALSSNPPKESEKSAPKEQGVPVPAEEAYPPPGSGGAPVPLAISPTPKDPSGHLTPTEAAMGNAPALSPLGIAGPASAAYSSEATEKAWKAATPPGSRNNSRPSTGRTSQPRTASTSTSTAPAGDKAKAKQPHHPIQGGRQGPLGLAHPPPPPKNTKAEFPALASSKPSPKKAEPEPRVRKEVKVREGGANDVGSLAARLRGMVLANAAQESPRQRRERVAGEGGKEDGAAAA